MNQIIEHTPNKGSKGKSSKTDKIVRVFFIFLIIFAICIISVGVYSIFKNKKQEQEIVARTPSKAKITVEKDNENVIIKVEHDKVIQKIIYNWDKLKELEVQGNNESTMEITIPISAGEHELHIKVIDVDQQETTYSETISSNSGEDIIPPTIDYEVVTVEEENGEKVKKLKITAKDETAIGYVTYQWNEEDETREEASEENDKVIEFYIDIKKGQNDLAIFAYDKIGNPANVTKTFAGYEKPDVKIIVSEDKKNVDINCKHENGLKSIDISINGQSYKETDFGEDGKDVTYRVPLNDGNNKIIVKAVSVDNTETTAEDEILSTTQVQEDEIDINIKKDEENNDSAIVTISTNGVVKDAILNTNETDHALSTLVGQSGAFEVQIPLQDGNNVITIKIITENGTEKTVTKEISR